MFESLDLARYEIKTGVFLYSFKQIRTGIGNNLLHQMWEDTQPIRLFIDDLKVQLEDDLRSTE